MEAMADTTDTVDPWSTRGLPFTRTLPIYLGIVAGLVVAVIWLALDRPLVSFLPILVLLGGLAGAIAAARAPAGERSARFLDVAYPAVIAGVTSELFGAIGVIITGNDEGGAAVNTVYVYVFVTIFFVGFPLLIANFFQAPKRRLPDAVLAQIGEPYPTRRVPRSVTLRAEDGNTYRVAVLRGGFVAGIGLPFDPTTAVGVARDDVVPTGPKQVKAARAAARDDARSKAMSRRKDKDKGKGDAGNDDETTTTRPTPAPTSRTTPKGTPGKRKGSKR